jgi:hypothetical protein
MVMEMGIGGWFWAACWWPCVVFCEAARGRFAELAEAGILRRGECERLGEAAAAAAAEAAGAGGVRVERCER